MKLRLFLMTMLLSSVSLVMAQRTVTGTVTDDLGEPLIGATVQVVGFDGLGAVTEFDGTYSIDVPEGGTALLFTYTGFADQEVTIGSNDVVDVTMSEDAEILGEVVILGYRNSTNERSSVASNTLNAETITSRPNASVAQTLQGQVAGLNITTSSGQPGANSTINLRGVSSINGNTEPLFVLDGTPVDEDNFRSLNPNEIESISVLKDAGATAIYGNRGANGVIVIRTKKGSYNSGLKVDYSVTAGVSQLQGNKYDLNNAQEELLLENGFGNGRGSNLTLAEIEDAENEDWLDVFFREPLTMNHNLSFTTGGENINTFTSFGYMEQEGILVSSDLQRFNIRSNITGRSNDDKFNYSTNLSLNFSKSDEPNSIGTGAINRNFVLGAYQSVPYITVDDYVDGAALLSPLSFTNTPLFLYDRLLTYTRYEEEIKAILSLNGSYKITPEVTYASSLGADYTDMILTRAEGPTSFNALLFAATGDNTPGFQDQQSTRDLRLNFLNSLNWTKQYGDHGLDVSVFAEYVKGHFRTFGFRNEGLDPRTFYPGDGSGFVDDNASNDFYVDQANANILNSGLFSYFAALDYDYKGKYGFYGTIRRDASFRFAESNRWGTFYSLAARWNIDQEPFMANAGFDLLKLRASYGVTGNQRIVGTFYGAPDDTENFFATGGGYGGANSIFLSQIGNTTLRWEEVEQANVGIDFAMLKNRLRGNVDAYVKTTVDLFQSRPISAINATTSLNANIGSLRNSGFDLLLNYHLLKSSTGVNLELTFNTNYNKQNIIDLPTPDGTRQTGNTIQAEGGILGEYYVYPYVGVNPANGNLLFLDSEGNTTENPSPDSDRIRTGKNIFPDWQGGFGVSASYKGFFLDAQFNYTIGVDRFDFDLSSFINPSSIGQFRHSRDLERAWANPGDVTDIPSLRASNRALDSSSDRFIFSSDYLRLRFISFGYTFPQSMLNSIKLRDLKLFVNAENALTFTSWRGFDAESTNSTSRRYPTPRIFSAGLQVGF